MNRCRASACLPHTHIEMPTMLRYMRLIRVIKSSDGRFNDNQSTLNHVLCAALCNKIVHGLGGVQDYLPRPACRSGCDPCLCSGCGPHPHFRTRGCTLSGTLCGTHNYCTVSEEMKQAITIYSKCTNPSTE